MATAYLTSSQLNYFENVIITSTQQLKRWKKGTHLDNLYKEVIKISDFVSVPIQRLSNRPLTLVQEGKVNTNLQEYCNIYSKSRNSKRYLEIIN